MNICNLCRHDELDIRLEINEPDRFEAYVLSKSAIEYTARLWLTCNRCDVAVQSIASDMQAGLNAIANEYYAVDFGDIDLKVRQSRILGLPNGTSDNRNRIIRAMTFIKSYRHHWISPSSKLKVLDFGSGLGVFPIAFAKETNLAGISLDLHLVETDPRAIQLLKEIPNASLHEGLYKPQDHNNYDLIFMNKVLEHLSDPLQWILTIKKALAPEGLLYVEVPSKRSLLLDPKTDALGSLHFNLYDRAALSFLAHRASFEMLECEEVDEPSGKLTCYAVFENKMS